MEQQQQQQQQIDTFREKLAEWRTKVLFKNLSNETHESAFKEALRTAREVYYPQFIQRIEELKTEPLTNSEIDTLLAILGKRTTWDLVFLDKVRTILHSDLVEFPYTINTALIQQFKEEENFPPLE